MNTAAQFKSWLNKYEAAHQLSKRTGTAFDHTDLLRIALDRGVRFVVDVPTGTKDRQGRPMESGLWDLIIEGKDGQPGKQQIEFEINRQVSLAGITGAWVSRDGDRRQLPKLSYGAFPDGVTFGLRRQVVEDLAEELNKETAVKGR